MPAARQIQYPPLAFTVADQDLAVAVPAAGRYASPTGSARNTGMTRSVRSWYSAYGG